MEDELFLKHLIPVGFGNVSVSEYCNAAFGTIAIIVKQGHTRQMLRHARYDLKSPAHNLIKIIYFCNFAMNSLGKLIILLSLRCKNLVCISVNSQCNISTYISSWKYGTLPSINFMCDGGMEHLSTESIVAYFSTKEVCHSMSYSWVGMYTIKSDKLSNQVPYFFMHFFLLHFFFFFFFLATQKSKGNLYSQSLCLDQLTYFSKHIAV